MIVYDLILFPLLLYFALYLLAMGWIGILTKVPLIHRCPYSFHRPTVYLLILGLLFLDTIVDIFGDIPALIIFALLALDFIYETLHPFLASFVEITSASPETIEKALLDAFKKLGIQYEGTFPKYRLPEHKARLRVNYWPRLQKAELIMKPRKKMDLLLEIAGIVQEDFERDEGTFEIRGYVANIFAAFAILAIVIWQYLSRISQHLCP